MEKRLSALLLLSILLQLSLVGALNICKGQTSEEVTGVITSDTIWTKVHSPYTLTGPLLVNNAVTLTIEPGVTVNLRGYYIQVNGTLNARGNIVDKIYFNGGSGVPGAIAFSRYCPSWSEETGKGSIMENVVVNSSSIAISIGDTSPKINNNTIRGAILTVDADSTGLLTLSSPTITNNYLESSGYPLVLQIATSPLIINNTITGEISTESGSTVISGNYIKGSIRSSGKEDQITDNIMSGKGSGIGIRTGSCIIERNLITNYGDAIQLAASPVIRNNTIINNLNAISVPGYIRGSYDPQIYWNNIYNNAGYSVNLFTDETHPANDINASNNWWGTTNKTVIDQGIHDNKDDYNLGEVNYTPFLIAANSQSMPDRSVLPEMTVSPSPTTDQSVSGGGFFGLTWLCVGAIAVVGVVVVVLLVVGVVILRGRRMNAPVK
jgi:hypothetical protein